MEIGITALSFGEPTPNSNTEDKKIKAKTIEDFIKYFSFEYDSYSKTIRVTENSPEYEAQIISVPDTLGDIKIIDDRDIEESEGMHTDNSDDNELNEIDSSIPTEQPSYTADIKDTEMLNKVFYTNELVNFGTTVIDAIKPNPKYKHIILRGNIERKKGFPYQDNEVTFEKIVLSPSTFYIFEDIQNNPIVRTITFAEDNPMDIRDIKRTSEMFAKLKYVEEINLAGFNLSTAHNLSDMTGMFEYCQKLKKVTFGKNNFITNQISSTHLNMSDMFKCCPSLEEVDLTAFDTLLSTKHNSGDATLRGFLYCNDMFVGCKNLKTVKTSLPQILDQYINNR